MKHFTSATRLLSLAAVLLFCLSAVAFAQEITGSIVGTVKDANGAAVKGATVTITNSDTKLVARTVTTNDDGEFSAPLLPVAFYDVTVEATNFKKHIEARVKLNVNERHTVDLTLQPGNISETVTVTQEALQVDTQTATASTVINGGQVVNLPINNRNWAQLILLSPGYPRIYRTRFMLVQPIRMACQMHCKSQLTVSDQIRILTPSMALTPRTEALI